MLGAIVRPVFSAPMRVAAGHFALSAVRIAPPRRLRIAPPDLRTGDATVAQEIFAGVFTLAGKTIDAGAHSPFSIDPAPPEWRRALLGFSWLRHLRAASEPQAHDWAQRLVDAYLQSAGLGAGLEPGVAARRMLSFLAHSPMLLDEASEEVYDAFMAVLARDARILARCAGSQTASFEKLLCALALMEFGLCGDLDAPAQSQITQLFFDEVDRQILPDGGHIGRNPQTSLDFLLDLLPLRQVYAARGLHAPPSLQAAVDRMIQMLRLLRHGDGSLALFNGMDATAPGKLATVFMHEPPSEPPPLAPHSGYARLSRGEGLAIVDCGMPPPREFSRRAHAGALSFEFSLGRERIVVNCGGALRRAEATQENARTTPQQSTLAIDAQSSCEFAPLTSGRRPGLIVSGPGFVTKKLRRLRDADVLWLAHDGYARSFGLVHRRRLALSGDGASLLGLDRLTPSKTRGRHAGRSGFALHFHLHPSVEARLGNHAGEIELLLPSGAKLLFEAPGLAPTLEESVFFATPEGPRKTKQIVLRGPAAPNTRVAWRIEIAASGSTDPGAAP